MKLKSILAAISILFTSSAFSAVLYDINFAEPLNTNGSAITIDSSINTPSEQTSGTTEMIVGYAGISGNWAVFKQSDCATYDQVKLVLPTGQKQIYLEADIFSTNLSSSDNAFSLYIDSTGYGARNLYFHGNGSIRVFNSGGNPLGSFNDNQQYHVKIFADAINDKFIIDIDNAEVYSSTLGSSDITSFRLSISPWTASATNCTNAAAAISNIKVYESPTDLLPPPAPPKPKAGSTTWVLLTILGYLSLLRLRHS